MLSLVVFRVMIGGCSNYPTRIFLCHLDKIEKYQRSNFSFDCLGGKGKHAYTLVDYLCYGSSRSFYDCKITVSFAAGISFSGRNAIAQQLGRSALEGRSVGPVIYPTVWVV